LLLEPILVTAQKDRLIQINTRFGAYRHALEKQPPGFPWRLISYVLPPKDSTKPPRCGASTQILGVSRPTLNEWLEGNQPSAPNTRRLTLLVQMLSGSGVSGSAPLNTRFVRQPLALDRPSLVELLSQHPLSRDAALTAIAEARRLGDEATRSAAARQERLRQRGFDEVSEQQRSDQLATTLTRLDPSK
jgi:hypothetical protein